LFIESTHKELTCFVNATPVTVAFEDGLAEVDEEVGNFLMEVGAAELSAYTGEDTTDKTGESNAEKKVKLDLKKAAVENDNSTR